MLRYEQLEQSTATANERTPVRTVVGDANHGGLHRVLGIFSIPGDDKRITNKPISGQVVQPTERRDAVLSQIQSTATNSIGKFLFVVVHYAY